MARRGVFGRLPRAAPDLTNSIVALVREAQAQTDQNYVDAWKNGGKVEGKGVDDSRLLSHLKMRRDQLSPDDPAYDDWNNNYIQYDFAINESKMKLANDEGKVSDAAMAAFYRKWAGREDVQQDSEFYRSLLSNAAQWQNAAKQRSAGGSAAAKAKAHDNWVQGFYKANVQGGETANGYLLAIAKTYGAAPPNADSLDDIDPNSVAYHKFMDVVQDGVAEDRNVQGLINEMVTEIKKTNPNFTWSQSNLADLGNRADRGLKRLVAESRTDGERNDWSRRRESNRYEKSRIKQSAANERVQIAADTYATDLDNCHGDPYCGRNATQKFRDKLQKEVPNIVAGAAGVGRGLNVNTQDVRTSSALINTISQLDRTLAGEDNPTPAAVTASKGGGGEGAARPEYTIIDAAGGRSESNGWLANVGNLINQDAKRLDEGGWIETQPVESNGSPILDGDGRPVFQYVIRDKNTPPPAGAVAVPGVALLTDPTRVTKGKEEDTFQPTPHFVTPTTYVQPTPPDVAYQTPNGQSVAPARDGPGQVRSMVGAQDVASPWTELRGVKGPDGTARTIYRTGDATTGYLYHDLPPVLHGTKTDAAGRPVVTVTPAQDDKGNPYLRADMTSYLAGVQAARDKTPSGKFAQGTFVTSGATSTSAAIRDVFSGTDDAKTKAAKADDYLRTFQQGIARLPMTDPNKIAGIADLNQLNQTVTLYKTGKAGKALGDAYANANARTPGEQAAIDALARAGITANKYGQGEVDRRVSLMGQIDAADQRVSASSAARASERNFRDPGPVLPFNVGDPRSQIAKAKQDVLNPTISVSAIKIPGMDPMQQPGQLPGAWSPAQLFGAGSMLGPQAYPAPTTIAPRPLAGPPKPEPRTEREKPPVGPATLPGPTTAPVTPKPVVTGKENDTYVPTTANPTAKTPSTAGRQTYKTPGGFTQF
jgi:hypothetical protein